MEWGLLSILIFGLLLGFKHGLEPDHIIAVSTIASRSKTLWKSSLAGIIWGVGHTLTLFVFGVVVIIFKQEIPEAVSMYLELLVGFVLIYFGWSNLIIKKRSFDGPSNHDSYLKSLFIGIIHGFAGSAAMVLLTMSTVDTAWEGAVYILIFGLGTCVGMVIFTTILGIPFVSSKSKFNLNKKLIQFTGFISILFGLYYIYNLGFKEHLFKFLF